jgi:hypothetical protein
MHGFDAVWRSSCSRFKHYARHSAIRSPKPDPNRCHRPSVIDGDLISTVGPAVEDARLIDAALFAHSRRQLFANAVMAASRVAL